MIERQTPRKVMPFALRPLQAQDILQSEEIEREAFSTLFPPTSFRHELERRESRYLVASKRVDVGNGDYRTIDPLPGPENGRGPLISRLLSGAKSIWNQPDHPSQPTRYFISGYVGIWYMVDEAHIISVGVRRAYRGLGIGEMLLIGAVEQVMAQRARLLTLEVRVSNHVARNLYKKYGFKEQGLRKGYYADNREDAIIMTTDPVGVAPYPENFRMLVGAHERRWGYFSRTLF